MAKYTTEVRSICEFYANTENQTPADFLSVNEIIEKAAPKIFNFDFPIFDEAYRKPLECKILKHFFTKEIGFETVGLWQLKLETKLNEIMPYYNQLYKSELLEFNPLYNTDLTTTHTRTQNDDESFSENETQSTGSQTDSEGSSTDKTTQNATTNTTRNNTEKNAYSDTPQSQISNVDNYTYLTNYRNVNNNETDDTSQNTTTDYNSSVTGKIITESDSEIDKSSNRNITTTEDYTTKVLGKNNGDSYSKMLTEFRQTFLNLDMEVIEQLEELFMQVW